MLTLTRIVTAGVSFVFLFVVLWVGTLVFGSAVAGGIAGAKDPQNAQQAGAKAGEEFAENYLGIISVSAGGLAGTISCLLAFGGILPWCRRKDSYVSMDDRRFQ